MYLKFGLYQYANDELAVLRRVSSKDLDVLSLSATSLLMEGKYKNAVDLFQQIPKKFYEQESVGINYAIALFLSGEKREAVDILEDVELSSDSNWKSYYVYAAREIGVN